MDILLFYIDKTNYLNSTRKHNPEYPDPNFTIIFIGMGFQHNFAVGSALSWKLNAPHGGHGVPKL